jgi:hypothetical protein
MTPGRVITPNKDNLTEEMRLENGSELARTFFTSAALVGGRQGSAPWIVEKQSLTFDRCLRQQPFQLRASTS